MQFAGNDAPQPERYVVLRALGKGSFGTVDLVRDLQDGGRLLALKTVRLPSGTLLPRGGVDGLGGSLDGPPSGVLKEVRLLKALRHPNIVRLCHAFIGDSGGGSGDGSARGGGDGGDGSGGVGGIMGGVGGGVTFVHIAMEYCDAGDLKQRINSRKMSGSHFSEWQVRLLATRCARDPPIFAIPLSPFLCLSPVCTASAAASSIPRYTPDTSSPFIAWLWRTALLSLHITAIPGCTPLVSLPPPHDVCSPAYTSQPSACKTTPTHLCLSTTLPPLGSSTLFQHSPTVGMKPLWVFTSF